MQDPQLEPQPQQAAAKQPAAAACRAPGYSFLPTVTFVSSRYLLTTRLDLSGGTASLAAACSVTPGCLAFDSLGNLFAVASGGTAALDVSAGEPCQGLHVAASPGKALSRWARKSAPP